MTKRNGGGRGGGEEMHPRIAATKPKAAAMEPSAAGTTSCKAPRASPPSGRWESIAAKPRGSGVRRPSIPGMSRRSSARTVARLRDNARTLGPVIVESPLDVLCMFWIYSLEQKENNAKGRSVLIFIPPYNQWLIK